MNYNLYNYNSWNEIPIPEKKSFEKISNGCGGNINYKEINCLFKRYFFYFLTLIKPPLHIFFFSSCTAHDWGYTKGGNLLDKMKVDKGFLKYMLKDIFSKLNNLNFLKKGYYIIWALLYFMAVTFFGLFFFNFKTKK